MSGHNKWSQIKHRKGAEDARRSKLFSMLSRMLTVEAKKSGGDKNTPGLRKAIEKARGANMPSDNIERAIKNATGGDSSNFEEVTYEAYGPGGAALIIEGVTDNKNRTSQELKYLLGQHGASLAAPGSVTWAFEKTAEGWQAKTPLPLNETEQGTLANLLEALEDHADIKNVATNVADF
jgi:YebC/PmpR family DNA-binding regulatory protein